MNCWKNCVPQLSSNLLRFCVLSRCRRTSLMGTRSSLSILIAVLIEAYSARTSESSTLLSWPCSLDRTNKASSSRSWRSSHLGDSGTVQSVGATARRKMSWNPSGKRHWKASPRSYRPYAIQLARQKHPTLQQVAIPMSMPLTWDLTHSERYTGDMEETRPIPKPLTRRPMIICARLQETTCKTEPMVLQRIPRAIVFRRPSLSPKTNAAMAPAPAPS